MEYRDIKIFKADYYWIVLIAILIVTACIRIRLLPTPLERDEGEYAYMGQLLLDGVPPFKEAFNMKLPGTSIMYALFMLFFGQTLAAVHLGLLITNAASIVLVFLIGRKIFDAPAGIAAAAIFAILTISQYLLGFAAHATHFVMLFALGGFLLLLEAVESRQKKTFFFSGFLFGIAFVMKQPGIFFFFFALSIILLFRNINKLPVKEIIRPTIVFSCSFLIPLALVVAIVLIGGAIGKFWFWIVRYSLTYGSTVSGYESGMYLERITHIFWKYLKWFCILGAAGTVLLFSGRFPKKVSATLILFLFFSVLSVLPGWHFREHYFVLLAPACSLAAASVFYFINRIPWNTRLCKYFSAVLFILIIGDNAYSNREYYFTLSPQDIIKRYYGANYFAESMNIGNFIAANTSAGDRIAVVGSEPQIYFYSKRRSVSGHIYVYGMVEPQPYAREMQNEFIRDIELAKPKYIVYARIAYSWLPHPNSDKHIIRWLKEYSAEYYKCVGAADLIRPDSVKYVWGNDAERYIPASGNAIFIYQRTVK
jgi:4-amino-4-deoxy-L-arabinose transferase-like glycosyltransferase